MAKPVDDEGLWLQSQFLAAEEHVLGDKENNNKKNGVNADLEAAFMFPSEFPLEFGVTSPVESVAGSTETESSDEEEDFFAGLTRRLSQLSLHETRKHQLAAPITVRDKAEATFSKTRGLAGSPQSTLNRIGSWSGRSAVSGDGSPNGYSRVPSPETTPFADTNDPWEVIDAVAGQVARLKMSGEVPQLHFHTNRGLPSLPRPAAKNHTTPNNFSNQSLNHVSEVSREQVLKQLQCASVLGRQAKANWLVQQQQQQQLQVRNRGREVGYESVKCNRTLSLPQSAWPPLQVQHQNHQQVQYSGSGSRPVVLGRSSVKRGCGGTGVFLPRHYGNPSESSSKRTGCTPVLLPAKVVHALNLNIDDLNVTSQPRFSNAFATDYDALLVRRNALLMQQQRLSVRREEAANYEIRLPQEGTYRLF